MPISYRKTQCKMKGSKNYNKYYAKVVVLGNVSTQDLCDEISHSTTVTESDARAVFAELKVAIRRHLLNSQSVTIDGLGTFKPALKSALVDKAEDLTAARVKRVKINYQPEKFFTPSGELGVKGHRKGVFNHYLLSGASVQELPNNAAKQAEADAGTGE